MTETDTPKLAKKPRWTSLEIGLITITSLFFIVIVVLIILFATQSDKICTTADCTRSEGAGMGEVRLLQRHFRHAQ
ncbi:neprilysin-like [Gambusia affinis]|uniref:neprilysin-like n=1 Tax=Gambusia affinis TaxID=33528 RepID=UPI001CDBB576|nr:neprilysin-like [Gambusia affinis]